MILLAPHIRIPYADDGSVCALVLTSPQVETSRLGIYLSQPLNNIRLPTYSSALADESH